MKTGQTAAQLTAAASFEALIPEILTGSATATPDATASTLTNTFEQIRTFEHFDGGDGETGVLNYVLTNLRTYLPERNILADQLFSREYPAFYTFLGTLRDRSAAALEELFKECGELYKNLLTRACGTTTGCSREQRSEAWQQVLIMLQVYWQEVAKARAVAADLSSYKDPAMANAAAMWACLGALRVHDSFKVNLFREHPRIAPKLTTYIISTCARRGDMLGIQDQAQRAATAAARADNASKDARRDLDAFISSFNNWKRSVNLESGDDGKGKGKKRREEYNKNKNKDKQEEAGSLAT